MPVDVVEEPGRLLRVRITGRLQYAEFSRLQVVLEDVIRRLGKVKILIALDGFEGWEASGGWEDSSFQEQHDEDIEKMAFVGDPQWKEEMFAFTAKPFRPVAIEYFDPAEMEQARAWLSAPKP